MTGWSMADVAARVAAAIPEGSCVNLGIGLPLMVASHVPPGREIVFHSENGVLGVGPPPRPGEEDWDLVDAGKNPITLVAGGSYLSHSDSFCLIRGGYIDVAVMGAYEVSVRGDLANWWTGDGIPGVGGAMDLAACASNVYIFMRHTGRDGEPKLVSVCTLPLTATNAVTRVYTDLGVFRPAETHFLVEELAPGCTLDGVQQHTAAPVKLPSEVGAATGP